MTVTQLITGTVAGFVLVIDPNNEKGKRERIEFSDATLMDERIVRLRREDCAFYKANPKLNYDPTEESFCTVYRRDDNGEMEQEDAFDPSGKTKVGDAAHKKFCKRCNKPMWYLNRNSSPQSTECTCADCNDNSDELSRHDFTNYDGMQEREY